MAQLGKSDLALDIASAELKADEEEHVCLIEKLPALSSGVLVRLSREDWPEGHVADLHIDIRDSDSKEWQHWATVDLVGGALFDTRTPDRKPRPVTHAEIIAEWPGENPNEKPRNKEERDTRKMQVMQEVRVRLKVIQPIRTRIEMRTFILPGAKLIERASEVQGRG